MDVFSPFVINILKNLTIFFIRFSPKGLAGFNEQGGITPKMVLAIAFKKVKEFRTGPGSRYLNSGNPNNTRSLELHGMIF